MNLDRQRSHERGIVLVVTVLVLSVLLVLGYTFSYSAAVNLSAARNARTEMVRQFGSESALNYAIGLLREDGCMEGTDSLDEDWAADQIMVEVDANTYVVSIVDENRKLNVNRAVVPPEDPEKSYDLVPVLSRLVREAGGSDKDFDILMAGIDPSRPMPLIAALHGLSGIDMELFKSDREFPAIDELLTTHPQHINLNTASEALLDALWDDPGLTRSITAHREAVPFGSAGDILDFFNGRLAPEEASRVATLLDVESDYFTIRVVPAVDGLVPELTALVHREDDAVTILSVQKVLKETLP